MLTLLIKDFKLMFVKEKSIAKRILSTILTIFFIGCFIGIEVFLFTTILKKIDSTPQATSAFTTLFLFVISIMIMVSGIFRANKLFFDEKDIEQLSVRPVSNSSIIFSKLVFLFLSHYVTSFIFVYPLFVAYGSIYTSTMKFYYLGLFYPVLSFFFEMGIALIFVYPFYLLKKFLKRHINVRFVLHLLILIIGCYLYSNVLNIFIETIAGNNFDSLLTVDVIKMFINFKKFEVPANLLSDIFFARKYGLILFYLAIGFGLFILGVSISVFAFNYVRNIAINYAKPQKERAYKQDTVTKTLIKKELTLLARTEGYTLSFTGLLIVQPFLAYLVIKALNTIFTNGIFSYYISVVPSFITLMDILILMLFTVIIAQGASQYIQSEKKTIKLLKTIPVPATKQLFIKVLIPCGLSLLSLFITLLVLVITGMISFVTFIFALLLITILLLIFNAISLKEELSIRNDKARSYFMSNLYSYLLPILYFVVTAVLAYFGLSIYIVYLIGIVLFVILGIPHILYLKKNMESLFMDLDVIN